MKGLLTHKFIMPKRINMILPEIRKNWKIIDLGCGDGWLADDLKKRGYNCYKLPWITNPIKYPDNYFDCTILIEVIEHLPEHFLKEIERITKKKIIISTVLPNFKLIFDLLMFMKLINPYGTPHIHEYKLKDIHFKDFKLTKEKIYWILCQFGVFNIKQEK